MAGMAAFYGAAGAAGAAQLKASQEPDTFLFCIPLQVGPATSYARNVKHWMHSILLLQMSSCLFRMLVIKDISGSFWMIIIVGLGGYAYYQDMNITYVCCWGVACAINGFFDTLGLIFPILLDLVKLSLFNIILRVLAPLSELLGAGFAWHLYVDYYTNGAGHGSYVGGLVSQMKDPMGKLVDRTDPHKAQSLVDATHDQEIKSDLTAPAKQIAEKAAGSASALGGFWRSANAQQKKADLEQAAVAAPIAAAAYQADLLKAAQAGGLTTAQAAQAAALQAGAAANQGFGAANIWATQQREQLGAAAAAAQPALSSNDPFATQRSSVNEPWPGQEPNPAPMQSQKRKNYAACC